MVSKLGLGGRYVKNLQGVAAETGKACVTEVSPGSVVECAFEIQAYLDCIVGDSIDVQALADCLVKDISECILRQVSFPNIVSPADS